MSEADNRNQGQMRRRSDHQRLESWKAIANYLNRSVRTVRRWETYEGLPVHRHKHTRGASVYAYCHELDAWRGRHRTPQAAAEETPAATRNIPKFAAAAMLLVTLAASVWKFGLPLTASTQDQNDAWVLVAKATGNANSVGENLEASLLGEIGDIENRHRLPVQRVRDALKLMRADPHAELDPAIARMVALRDGHVSALLLPSVEQLGGALVLSVEITDPHSGELIAYPSENVPDIDGAVAAIDKLARRVRAELVELPQDMPASPLPHVTTDSISALELYAQAETMLMEDLHSAARELLRLAVTEDQRFASAMTLQAWAARRSGASIDDYLPLAAAAANLADGLSLQERYFVIGSYHLFAGNLAEATAQLQTLIELQPNHLPGAQALVALCKAARPSHGCSEDNVRLADLRPDHFESNLEAAWSLAADASDPELTEHYARRMQELLVHSGTVAAPESAARAMVFPIISAWTEGNLDETFRRFSEVRSSLPDMPPETREYAVQHLLGLSLSFGHLEEARELVELFEDPAQRHEMRAVVLFASGKKKELKDHLASGRNYEQQFTALLLSMAGFPDQALALHDTLRASGMNDAQGAVVRAIVALGSEQPQVAKAELQSVVDKLEAEDQAYYFVGPDMLANILKGEGDVVGALTMLESTAPRRIEAAYNNSGVFWMMCQRALARLYREAGRELEAIRIEEQLRGLLIHADDDFPLAQSLKEA